MIAFSRKLLGKWLFGKMMKSTFYGHFVAGEDNVSIKPVVGRIRKYGVKSILDYSVERDIDESEAVNKVKKGLAEVVCEPNVRPDAATKKYQTSLQFADRSKQVVGARTYFYESEYQCDKNMETFLQCIDSVSHSTEKEGFAAIKVTALGRPQLLLDHALALLRFALRHNGYRQKLPPQLAHHRLRDPAVCARYEEKLAQELGEPRHTGVDQQCNQIGFAMHSAANFASRIEPEVPQRHWISQESVILTDPNLKGSS
ncbi:unnamed protein product [Echinostoma caproni]|uniref:Proline dehydrogenase n=1 Tax=Echinostoma caproni TaxID=27848 RepID=A0A3P8HI88_9TREM|nr:unnamed protein product [Echinostoma caproni]